MFLAQELIMKARHLCQETEIFFSRKKVDCETSIESSHARQFHTTTIQRAEIVKFHLSDIGEGIKEVTVKEWFINVGDKVSQFDQLCEVQSDKASVTITSRYDGIIKKIHFQVDEIAQTGDALVDIETIGEDDSSSSDSSSDSDAEVQELEAINVGEESPGKHHKKALAAPAVRRIATEHGVHITEVMGSGREGRVLKEDILSYIEQRKGEEAGSIKSHLKQPVQADAKSGKPKTESIRSAPPSIKTLPVTVASSEDKTVPLKGITKAMNKAMSESLKIPHFGYSDEIDIGRLVDVRKRLKASTAEKGIKLSYMPFFVKACSMALAEYPIMNSYFNAQQETITYKADHNIGVAMDTAHGLLVPNIKRVQLLSVLEIAQELNRLQELGWAGKLGESELKGGTFALSNIGSIGGTYASPVIFPPQVAIGAIGRVQALPRFDEHDNVIKAHIVKFSWSADHRVLDGATVARFSNAMKGYLEEPASMVMNLR